MHYTDCQGPLLCEHGQRTVFFHQHKATKQSAADGGVALSLVLHLLD